MSEIVLDKDLASVQEVRNLVKAAKEAQKTARFLKKPVIKDFSKDMTQVIPIADVLRKKQSRARLAAENYQFS